jgi:hypothetical protein
VSESLAGRSAVIELDPLMAQEAAAGPDAMPWARLWLKGGFPDALRGDSRAWWESYLRMVLDRGRERIAVEVKVGRGNDARAARVLREAMPDVDAARGWVVDQAAGIELLGDRLARAGFAEVQRGLP